MSVMNGFGFALVIPDTLLSAQYYHPIYIIQFCVYRTALLMPSYNLTTCDGLLEPILIAHIDSMFRILPPHNIPICLIRLAKVLYSAGSPLTRDRRGWVRRSAFYWRETAETCFVLVAKSLAWCCLSSRVLRETSL